MALRPASPPVLDPLPALKQPVHSRVQVVLISILDTELCAQVAAADYPTATRAR